MDSFLEPATLLKTINFAKKFTLKRFSRILFKNFRGLVLQNTMYFCGK